MAIQNALKDNAVSQGLLGVDGATDTETRRLHTLAAGTVNALAVAIVDGAGAQVNLGKAEDVAHVSGDTGVAMLGVYNNLDDTGVAVGTSGDYAMPRFDFRGRLRVSPGALFSLDNFNATTGWAAIDGDTTNLATTTNHVIASNALTFDKANTAANNTVAMIEKTITSANIFNLITGAAFIQAIVRLPDVTNILNVVIRLGTDSSNYNTWKVDASTAPVNRFESFRVLIGDSEGSTGNGWLVSAVTYIAVGVEFAAETNTLVGIIFDNLIITAGQVNSADTTSDITTQINTPNINVHRIGGSVTDKGAGNASSGSQRMVLATNDINTAAINLAVTSKYITGVANGRTVVTTAGTRVVLAGSTVCKKVDITAETDNTGLIVVGGTGVIAALATRQGVPLNAGDTYSLEIDNLNDINIDATVSSDGVTYTYYT